MFNSMERKTGDFRGYYFIPPNPAGVILAEEERKVDEDMGMFARR